MSKTATVAAAVVCLLTGGCTQSSRPPNRYDPQVRALKDSDPAVRRHAAQELAEAGKAAGQSTEVLRAYGDLVQGLDDQDKETSYWCAIALVHAAVGRIPAPVGSLTRPLLTEAAKDGDAETRAAAEEALKKLGPETPPGPPGGRARPATDKETPATGKEQTATGKEVPATVKEHTATGKETPATGRAAGSTEKK